MSIIDELISSGWIDGGFHPETRVRQAWPKHTSPLRSGLCHCECNDAPPSIVAEYYEVFFNGRTHQLPEVVLRGERGGRWFMLRAYSLDTTVAAVEAAARSLGAAWEALPADVVVALGGGDK